jgi:hypothetical protein
MLRNLGEFLEVDIVVCILTVDPTQYVIDFYTQRNNFLGKKINKISPYIININYTYIYIYIYIFIYLCQSQWPRGLRRMSSAARLLRLWVRIQPGGMDVCLL